MINYYIYKITNPIGQIYIGQTYRLEKRLRFYKNLACKGQKLLYKSFVHFGYDNHNIEIIDKDTIDNLDNLEINFINSYNSYYKNNPDIGLNLTKGGKSKRFYNKKLSNKLTEKHKLKLSLGAIERIKNGSQKSPGKIVFQYNEKDEIIKEWKSMKELCRNLPISHITLQKNLSKHGLYKKENIIIKSR